MSWQPSASIENLKARAKVLANIRTFFQERDVLEVDTHALSHATVTDAHLVSFDTQFAQSGSAQHGNTLYLQTSPEFAMKRLLAAGSGAIYQICKAFRNEEAGRFHNPEFTMLEWYRPGFDHFQLMAELNDLFQRILDCQPASQYTYQSLFQQYVGIDPLTASLGQLQRAVIDNDLHADWAAVENDKDTLMQYLFAELVERKIGKDAPCFVYDFPASQAALAKINSKDPRVAERFELYYHGIELANGFHELTNADEQLARFEQDNQWRTAHNLATKPIDHNLIDALKAGLPQCSGVALGIDRLVMLALNADHIEQVLTFPIHKA